MPGQPPLGPPERLRLHQHAGFSYEPERRRRAALSRRSRFTHIVVCPDGAEVVAPFAHRFLAARETFVLWVELRTGARKLSYKGYAYVPERSNSWQQEAPRFRHKVYGPDGALLAARFAGTGMLDQSLFEFWIDSGQPDPSVFGRRRMSRSLLERLCRLKRQHGIADHQLAVLAVFDRLAP